jgi:molybdopterin synthase sulfur carrier subunit
MQIGFYATLRPIVGAKRVDVDVPEGATVGDLVALLVARWPALAQALLDESGALSRRAHVFVDGRSARFLEGEQTRLDPTARIDVIPAVAGG